MKPNVIELVVKKDRCIGCGTCAGMCPVNVLSMDFNKSGCYEPYEIPGCLSKCTICLKVCPFYDKDLKEIGISNELYKTQKSYKEMGNFIGTYEFYIKDEKERIKSASGGAGYYILSELLSQKKVDKIIAIEPNDDPEMLFKFSVFDNVLDLQKSKKSAYYPTNMESILKYILKNDYSYVITALPCFAKAIRLVQKTNPKIRKRVKFIVGLVCGQLKSKNFTQTLADLNFKTHKKLKKVDFRHKLEGRPSSNFAFKFTSVDDWSSVDDRKTSPSIFWSSRAFTPLACNNCNDTFALCADAVLMDAWLGKFTKDWRGHSLIITRNHEIDEMLKNADKNFVHCESFDYKQVYVSQKPVVDNKSMFFHKKLNFISKAKLKLQINTNLNPRDFNKYLEEYLKQEKIYKIMIFSMRVVRKIIREIKAMI
ncbi:Coenzyme F420 hydrogenase/dehydrogenase, beta subunit C-terminal domain [Campylobacter corcagiensis]|uniref:Coenzyme F420 hydrogenase/dehydrogenase, beta subunit C-terminal domain n=1 Tax=Campylobacter corcagiensis TaxID=1448857 RepID=A0A7M1LFY0_9BACT|nr:Coenzyme F420 hydrogenase/dehydrogenase, beta subunit C-terminal domain [Campylobacter corcagiensis]QKF65043.1 coenzyme F420 hydrogenase/dehydrogenase, beta subunit family protein [Campylobacter corcagiensis]QOQ86806.1 Coenzyme F420 hydrogenase/dehydrogenase, beta subunit C-terminal domain [Campylobacter corcagiensis]